MKIFNLTAILKGLYSGRPGNPVLNGDGIDYALPNAKWIPWRNAADTAEVNGVRVNASNVLESATAITAPGFNGPVTGNVTGNVSGNLTGNVTGNVTGNIAGQISASSITYTDTYWDDALCNIGTLTNGNTPADPINFGPSGTRPKIYGFSVNEDMDGTLQFSHRYKEGTNIIFHVHWAAAATTGNVKWEVAYYWLNVGGAAVGNPATAVIESAVGGTAWTHSIASFPTITGTAKTVSSILIFKIKRIAASTAEMSGDAALLSIDAHFEIDSPGSRETLTK